jgi:hypothetical protein
MSEHASNELNKLYLEPLNQVLKASSVISSLANQLSISTDRIFQERIAGVVDLTHKNMELINFNGVLPFVETTSPIFDFSRTATLALGDLRTPGIVADMAKSIEANFNPWYLENVGKIFRNRSNCINRHTPQREKWYGGTDGVKSYVKFIFTSGINKSDGIFNICREIISVNNS